MNTVHNGTATAGEWKAANVYPTVDALAEELGPSRQVVCRELRAGTIPAIRQCGMVSQAMAKHIEHWPLHKLIPYVRNPRTHSYTQVAQIAASIVEFGFNNPILVDANAGTIAGHGRLLAAPELRLQEVPVIVLDHGGSYCLSITACVATIRIGSRVSTDAFSTTETAWGHRTA